MTITSDIGELPEEPYLSDDGCVNSRHNPSRILTDNWISMYTHSLVDAGHLWEHEDEEDYMDRESDEDDDLIPGMTGESFRAALQAFARRYRQQSDDEDGEMPINLRVSKLRFFRHQ